MVVVIFATGDLSGSEGKGSSAFRFFTFLEGISSMSDSVSIKDRSGPLWTRFM